MTENTNSSNSDEPYARRHFHDIQIAHQAKKQQLNLNWKRSIAAARQLEEQL